MRAFVAALDEGTQLQSEYNRLQARIDAMHVDKLCGRIDAAFFDRKAAQWREEQTQRQRSIDHRRPAPGREPVLP